MKRTLAVLAALAAIAVSPVIAGATRLTLLASAAQVATGNGAAFNTPNLKELSCVVDVTAVSSGTTLTVFLQGSEDGGTTFSDLTADAVIEDANTSATSGTVTTNARNLGAVTTAAKRTHAKFTTFSDTVRIRWVLVGTSYTFSVRCVGK